MVSQLLLIAFLAINYSQNGGGEVVATLTNSLDHEPYPNLRDSAKYVNILARGDFSDAIYFPTSEYLQSKRIQQLPQSPQRRLSPEAILEYEYPAKLEHARCSNPKCGCQKVQSRPSSLDHNLEKDFAAKFEHIRCSNPMCGCQKIQQSRPSSPGSNLEDGSIATLERSLCSNRKCGCQKIQQSRPLSSDSNLKFEHVRCSNQKCCCQKAPKCNNDHFASPCGNPKCLCQSQPRIEESQNERSHKIAINAAGNIQSKPKIDYVEEYLNEGSHISPSSDIKFPGESNHRETPSNSSPEKCANIQDKQKESSIHETDLTLGPYNKVAIPDLFKRSTAPNCSLQRISPRSSAPLENSSIQRISLRSTIPTNDDIEETSRLIRKRDVGSTTDKKVTRRRKPNRKHTDASKKGDTENAGNKEGHRHKNEGSEKARIQEGRKRQSHRSHHRKGRVATGGDKTVTPKDKNEGKHRAQQENHQRKNRHSHGRRSHGKRRRTSGKNRQDRKHKHHNRRHHS